MKGTKTGLVFLSILKSFRHSLEHFVADVALVAHKPALTGLKYNANVILV